MVATGEADAQLTIGREDQARAGFAFAAISAALRAGEEAQRRFEQGRFPFQRGADDRPLRRGERRARLRREPPLSRP